MTIAEAENQYKTDVENARQWFIMRLKKSIKIWNSISIVLIVAGIVLTIIGFTTPPEIDSIGYESLPAGALCERIFGIALLILGVFWLLIFNLSYKSNLKRGPKNFNEETKTLYLNYLKCSDMSDTDKEFYKQKLEEMRNSELVSAIRSAAASNASAIMFTTLRK